MPEILGHGGIYFDPSNPVSISAAIEAYLLNPSLREEKQKQAHQLSKAYSWQRCAHETVAFLHSVVAQKNSRTSN